MFFGYEILKLYCTCLSVVFRFLVILSDSVNARLNLRTHISDPDGYPLIKEVEDHDDDKVDAGSSDRSR